MQEQDQDSDSVWIARLILIWSCLGLAFGYRYKYFSAISEELWRIIENRLYHCVDMQMPKHNSQMWDIIELIQSIHSFSNSYCFQPSIRNIDRNIMALSIINIEIVLDIVGCVPCYRYTIPFRIHLNRKLELSRK